MSTPLGKTPPNGLNDHQMKILEGFVGHHSNLPSPDAQFTHYSDQTSAYMRDQLTGTAYLDISDTLTYYTAMSGLSLGTVGTEALVVASRVPLGVAAAVLMKSAQELIPNSAELGHFAKYLQERFDAFEVNLADERLGHIALWGMKLGAEWTEGIATQGMPIQTAAEITRVSFARLSPLKFNS